MQTRGLFFKPEFTGLTAFKPGTRVWYPGLTYGGSLVSGRLANRVLYTATRRSYGSVAG